MKTDATSFHASSTRTRAAERAGNYAAYADRIRAEWVLMMLPEVDEVCQNPQPPEETAPGDPEFQPPGRD